LGCAKFELDDWHNFKYCENWGRYKRLYTINKKLFSKNINTHSIHPFAGRLIDSSITKGCKEHIACNSSHVWRKFHNATIAENHKIFYAYIALLREKKVSISIVVPPFHRIMMDKHENEILNMKELFYHEIKQYEDLKLIDMFLDPISNVDRYWADGEHLNFTGAMTWTKKLNDLLK